MRHILIAISALLVFPELADAQDRRKPITRAKRPVFQARDKSDFFNDIFKDALVGERPADFGSTKVVKSSNPNTGTPEEEVSSGFAWTSLISPESIQDEVKSIRISLDKTITTPNSFRSGGSKIARVEYTMLGMLFGVINEYDGEVKWKKNAAGARDAFARCAANASTSTDQAYQQAKSRKLDLGDLLNGASVTFNPVEEKKNQWGNICDRTPLMIRLKKSYGEVLKPFTANESDFKANVDKIKREAELVAVMARVLTMEGLDDSEDEDYCGYSERMKIGALDLLGAIKANDFDKAGSAVGVIDKACNACHEDWQ